MGQPWILGRKRRAAGGAMSAVAMLAALAGATVGTTAARAAATTATWYAGANATNNDTACQNGAGASSYDPCGLQQALDAAQGGDTIVLAPGAYIGPFSMVDKNVNLQAANPGYVTVSSGGPGSALTVQAASSNDALNLEGIDFEGGHAVSSSSGTGGNGGGIDIETGTVFLEDSNVTDNVADGYGGGVYVAATGTLQISQSTISDNTAGLAGGGLYNSTRASVYDSAVVANTVTNGPGGGIFDSLAELSIEASTIDGNVASDQGGGIYSDAPSQGWLTVAQSTIADNQGGAGDAANIAGDQVSLVATIVARPKNQEPNCADTNVTDYGYNIDDDGTCGLIPASSFSGTASDGSTTYGTALDVWLGPLSYNSGLIPTVRLLDNPSSTTVSAPDPAYAVVPGSFVLPQTWERPPDLKACGQQDENGTYRKTTCDIGAYERPGPPSAPSLTATAGVGTVSLSWNGAYGYGSPISDYVIDEYSGSTATGTPTVIDTQSAGTSYTATNLTAGRAYTFTVQAVSVYGASPFSSGATVTPTAPAPSGPGAPTLLSATPVSQGAVLTWSAPTAGTVIGYEVFEGTASGQETTTPVNPATLDPSVLSYTPGNLDNGQTYWFTVAALGNDGVGPSSNELSVTPSEGSPPVVYSVSPDIGTDSHGQVTITGSNLSDVSEVDFGTGSGGAVTSGIQESGDGTSITVTPPSQAAATQVDVTVTTPGGTSPATGPGGAGTAASPNDVYYYQAPGVMPVAAGAPAAVLSAGALESQGPQLVDVPGLGQVAVGISSGSLSPDATLTIAPVNSQAQDQLPAGEVEVGGLAVSMNPAQSTSIGDPIIVQVLAPPGLIPTELGGATADVVGRVAPRLAGGATEGESVPEAFLDTDPSYACPGVNDGDAFTINASTGVASGWDANCHEVNVSPGTTIYQHPETLQVYGSGHLLLANSGISATTPIMFFPDGRGGFKVLAGTSGKKLSLVDPSLATMVSLTDPVAPATAGGIDSGAYVYSGGAASVIAVGGANVIAAGGANVIAAGGANVIAAGGANIINTADDALAGPASAETASVMDQTVDGGSIGIAASGVIAAGGANVIAVGGANVIAAGGANVIAAGGANVIAAGGANIMAGPRASVTAHDSADVTYSMMMWQDPTLVLASGPPTAPLGVSAPPGVGSASVSWSPPALDGGSAVTSYTVTAHPHGVSGTSSDISVTTDAKTTWATLSGLVAGTAYDITVTAANAKGTGPASPAVSVSPLPTTTSLPSLPIGSTTASSAPGDPSAAQPVIATVTDPNGGPITFGPATGTALPTWATAVGQPMTITAPAGSASSPLQLVFRAAGLPTNGRTQVFRDGVAVGPCTGSGASPDPCLVSQSTDTNGITTFTVLSSHASTWALGATTNVAPIRLSGADRDGTAVAISAAKFANGAAGAVVLARNDDYPDALAGGPLAAALKAPLLLTPSSGLDEQVAAEIHRVLPSGGTVYLLGGTSALSSAVQSAVTAMGFTSTRVQGSDRYQTALDVAELVDHLDGGLRSVFEVTGTDFPDALSSVSAAVANMGAIVLTRGATADPSTTAWLSSHPGLTRYAVGGPAAQADPSATALVGADRYATAAAVASRFFPSPSQIGVATGTSFADAVAAGPAVSGPLVLVPGQGDLPAPLASYLSGLSVPPSLTIFGGLSAVDAGTAQEVAGVLP
jgi:hypothetical protein